MPMIYNPTTGMFEEQPRDEIGRFESPAKDIHVTVEDHGVVRLPVAQQPQENPVSEPKPTTEDLITRANIFARFFQDTIDQLVDASNVAKQVEALKEKLTELEAHFAIIQGEMEVYRETNARLDDEIRLLREERQRLQDENASLHSQLEVERYDLANVKRSLDSYKKSDETWRQDYQSVVTDFNAAKREKEDAQFSNEILKDEIATLKESVEYWKNVARTANHKLDAIEATLRAQEQSAA